ncbi:MAG TPA: DUF1015 domain-containing protein [Terriglobales bacterium]|nr:DUF1015 domain-containing protein [Terriglobales bacterium]
MAQILSFRAWRYDPRKVRLEDVLTQPYDKITPAMQASYYEKSPYNLIRMELGRSEPGDDEKCNVYSRAAGFLEMCRHDGAIVLDKDPAIYAYSQTFAVPGRAGVAMTRRGFIGLSRLHDYADGVVYRHEQTLSKPKADRLNLLRATQAHTGQIFMLYSDPDRQVDSLIWAEAGRGSPVAEMKDEYAVQHRLWKITEPGIVLAVRNHMEHKKLIIADGHHRYETALAYRNERRADEGMDFAEFGRTGQMAIKVTAPYEKLMMTFINMEDEGLLILPTHRLVSGLAGFDAARMLTVAGEWFSISDLDVATPVEAAIANLHSAGQESSAILARTAQGLHLLRAKPDAVTSFLKSMSPLQRQLDVVQLHKILLERVLAISEEAIRNQTNVEYLRDAAEAFQRVQRGADVAFLMNPVKIEQMRDVALAGEVMPQKSTDFYPKLMSGLTIYGLNERANETP